MKLYLNKLAPWERKKEYFYHIQLGKDVNSQANTLRQAIDNQTRVNLASASAVIVSQEKISEGIQDLGLVITSAKPPIIIPGERRQEYIEALSEYHLAAGTVIAGNKLLPDVDKLDRFKQFCHEAWSDSLKLVDNARKKQQERSRQKNKDTK